MALVALAQMRNNARVAVAGSVDMFSDAAFDAEATDRSGKRCVWAGAAVLEGVREKLDWVGAVGGGAERLAMRRQRPTRSQQPSELLLLLLLLLTRPAPGPNPSPCHPLMQPGPRGQCSPVHRRQQVGLPGAWRVARLQPEPRGGGGGAPGGGTP